MNRQNIVLDNNVLVSAALLPNSVSAKAYKFARDNLRVIYSSSTLMELQDTLFRTKFDKYISIADRTVFVNYYIQFSVLVDIHAVITDCRDVDDNKFLELAIDGQSEYLITGDKDLLVLHPFRNISIITPSAFLDKFAVK